MAGTFLVLAVLVALFIAFFDWNWLREPIARRVSSFTGRSFAINGDLKVHLSLRPRIVAHDVVLGNATWSSEPVMAEVKRIDFRLDLLKLLSGRVDLPELALSQPRIALEVSRSGAVNWAFKEQVEARPPDLPAIGMLSIDGGTATYRDPVHNTDLAFDLKTPAGDAKTSAFGLELTGKGRYKGLPSSVDARGGALLNLRDAQHPYPIEANGTVGTTHFSIDGMLLDPLHFKGEQLNFKIAGSDLALLFPIIGVPMPPTPAYKFAGFLDHAHDVWAFRRFKGTLGQSDLAGDFSIDRGKHPQKLVATLVSKAVVLKDLAGFIGAKRDDQPGGRAPRTKVLPAEPFRLDKLMAADVDVKFRGEKVVTANLPLDKMSAHLIVNGGVVKLAPLDFGLAGGNVVSTIEIDSRQPRHGDAGGHHRQGPAPGPHVPRFEVRCRGYGHHGRPRHLERQWQFHCPDAGNGQWRCGAHHGGRLGRGIGASNVQPGHRELAPVDAGRRQAGPGSMHGRNLQCGRGRFQGEGPGPGHGQGQHDRQRQCRLQRRIAAPAGWCPNPRVSAWHRCAARSG